MNVDLHVYDCCIALTNINGIQVNLCQPIQVLWDGSESPDKTKYIIKKDKKKTSKHVSPALKGDIENFSESFIFSFLF